MKRNPICTFLRKLISTYGYGSKDVQGYHRPTNQALLEDYNTRGYIRGLTNSQMLDHFEGRATHYFWADGRFWTAFCLLKIDIDCHHFGGLRSARAFAEHLRGQHFPDLYIEPSTNGNGVHAYVIIDKRGFDAKRLHSLCRTLNRALKTIHTLWQARNPDLPVELVEIKGQPPRITWEQDGTMRVFTSGQFAKLPRELLTRFEEFRNTTVLDQAKINALHDEVVNQPIVIPFPKAPKAIKAKGSLTGSIVKRETLGEYPAYLSLAQRLMPEPIKTSGREVATAEDLAIFLMILKACIGAMNSDGSMPTRRFQRNWESLHENGDVVRPWNGKRYTALRNFLSREGYLDWDDVHYIPGAMSPTGKGEAARWCAAEALLDLIDQEREGHLCGASQEVSVEGEQDFDEREREEHLCGDSQAIPVQEIPQPEWIRLLKLENYPRPTLSPTIWRLRKAG
jgi:hypothetical protein